MSKAPIGGKAARISLPSNLSFRRSVDVSEGGLYSVVAAQSGEALVPVEVVQTTVRGAMAAFNSGYAGGGAPLTGETLTKAQNPAKPNIQSIDRATLDPGSDLLSLRFSVAFHGAGTRPDACSDIGYTGRLDDFLKAARAAGLYRDLAARYFWNLVNGRTLWRNGCGVADVASVTDASHGGGRETITFNWGDICATRFPGCDAIAAAARNGKGGSVGDLIGRIADALAGATAILPLDVDVRVRLYKGAEVWPSQEFAEKSQKVRGDREISRILSSRPVRKGDREFRHATMHPQKIGNAIRTVDEWHGEEGRGAIPVEAFGWVQRDMVAIRRPEDRADSYAAFSDIAEITENLVAGGGRECGLYALAMILRGGVYGVGKGSDEAPEAVQTGGTAVAA